ncbi:YqzK family protein [Metabacillus sp. GX 13764]|uniref:YqzK family protein n=1 Tax=Metabacillus kandeliae TaxID=2900151 RepID=UPI001E6535BC|nr:YqzK family protein [Metabacillus kandeliae]MCD7033284.1 YqzK family protein [Metabacillus kandeliae]
MKRMLRAFFDLLKVFVIFTGFTILFYYAIIWVNLEYQGYHKYDEPEGAALKVTKMVHERTDDWRNRLIFFFLNGE